jgi:hypothetical protein
VSLIGWLLLVGVLLTVGCIVALTVAEAIEARRRRRLAAERLAAQVRLQRLTYAAVARMLLEARRSNHPLGTADPDHRGRSRP